MTRSKYRAKPVIIDGKRFASMAEGRRYGLLLIMQGAGEISHLKCQPIFKIEVNGSLVCKYVADFMYIDKDGKRVIEDVKSVVTAKLPLYRLKKKLVLAVHNIEIREVTA